MQPMVTPIPLKRQDFFEKIAVTHKKLLPLIYLKIHVPLYEAKMKNQPESQNAVKALILSVAERWTKDSAEMKGLLSIASVIKRRHTVGSDAKIDFRIKVPDI
jgi:hypothetical protein